jgi:hypothetical protein
MSRVCRWAGARLTSLGEVGVRLIPRTATLPLLPVPVAAIRLVACLRRREDAPPAATPKANQAVRFRSMAAQALTTWRV